MFVCLFLISGPGFLLLTFPSTFFQHLAVEGELVTSGNHVASNGVVHIIAGVMTPPNGTMVDILSADPEFSTLKAAVETAGLAAALNGNYSYLEVKGTH